MSRQYGIIPASVVSTGSFAACPPLPSSCHVTIGTTPNIHVTSKFASGFTPLQPEPLDSIVDVQRLKDRYPDDIASIWDDVEKRKDGICNLASGATKPLTHMREGQPRAHAYAWHTSPRPFPEFKAHAYAWTSVSFSRICVSQKHLALLMRGLLFKPRTDQSHSTHMRGHQPATHTYA
ncbi:hypothetical protein PIB30_030703 [Stylosanthes scabra]|uniref:Uncharacterized protein n=1 Tax=Stylosanthes scabra TaxID=79078 RepID=A0ABU6TBC7_9FABA|nr:hypothetical protein [Stylosanthes scabra]